MPCSLCLPHGPGTEPHGQREAATTLRAVSWPTGAAAGGGGQQGEAVPPCFPLQSAPWEHRERSRKRAERQSDDSVQGHPDQVTERLTIQPAPLTLGCSCIGSGSHHLGGTKSHKDKSLTVALPTLGEMKWLLLPAPCPSPEFLQMRELSLGGAHSGCSTLVTGSTGSVLG